MPNASVDLEIVVQERGESVEVVTATEVAQLRTLVRDWVAERKGDVSVIEGDDHDDLVGGRGADGAMGMGAGMWAGDVLGFGVVMVVHVSVAVAMGEGIRGRGGAGVWEGDDGAGSGSSGNGAANMEGVIDGGDDAPRGTDAGLDDLFGVFRARHLLSPATSAERLILRRKRLPRIMASRIYSG